MKEITLTQNKVALVDDEDFYILSQFNWCAAYQNKTGIWYAVRDGKTKLLKMHRVIMQPETFQDVDHADRNGLNNQRINLRLCNGSQNRANALPRKGSIYKGVSFQKSRNKFVAGIKVNYEQIFLGRFSTAEEAAIRYNEAASFYFKEFARLNVVEKKGFCE